MCGNCCEWHYLMDDDTMSYEDRMCMIDYDAPDVRVFNICRDCLGKYNDPYTAMRRKYKLSYWLSTNAFYDPDDPHREKSQKYLYRRGRRPKWTSADDIAACVVQAAWRWYRKTGSILPLFEQFTAGLGLPRY